MRDSIQVPRESRAAEGSKILAYPYSPSLFSIHWDEWRRFSLSCRLIYGIL